MPLLAHPCPHNVLLSLVILLFSCICIHNKSSLSHLFCVSSVYQQFHSTIWELRKVPVIRVYSMSLILPHEMLCGIMWSSPASPATVVGKAAHAVNTRGENINICWSPNGHTIAVGNKVWPRWKRGYISCTGHTTIHNYDKLEYYATVNMDHVYQEEQNLHW